MGSRNWRQNSNVFVSFLVIVTLLDTAAVFVEAQSPFCFDGGGNYMANSPYQANLNTLLSSLAPGVGNSGFFSGTLGEGSDIVSASALCRADTQLVDCRNCIRNATAGILNSCPLKRQAIYWMQDNCTVRYSNVSFSGILADSQNTSSCNVLVPGTTFVLCFNAGISGDSVAVLIRNTQNATGVQQFIADLRLLLDDLRNQASSGGSLMKAAAGNRSVPDFLTIYSLLQCIPDISADHCNQCLISAVYLTPAYAPIGFRVLFPHCMLRYETVPFFNSSRIQEAEALSALPPPPPPPLPVPPPALPIPHPPPGRGGLPKAIIIIIAVVAATSGCVILVACVFIIPRRRQMKKQREKAWEAPAHGHPMISSVESLLHDFDKIRAATDDFSDANVLGRGGFGAVYKGRLENGKEIAVKRLSRRSSQGESEFKNEVLLMASLQHRNLLKIVGFATRGDEKLLIYEFLQNSSLDHFIFDPEKRSLLDWKRRSNIIQGIARGLLYLHEDSRLRIIHRDLKASNVLLDAMMNPKIADFGLAKLFPLDQTEGNTGKIVGTRGYMPPEYVYRGILSLKIDVFSFGVLVLEIVTGKRNGSFSAENLPSYCWRNWEEGRVENLIDTALEPGSETLPDMLRCIHVGLLCVQDDAAARPTMGSVVMTLNGSAVATAPPSRPKFSVPSSTEFSVRDGDSAEAALLLRQNGENDASRNQASITELDGR